MRLIYVCLFTLCYLPEYLIFLPCLDAIIIGSWTMNFTKNRTYLYENIVSYKIRCKTLIKRCHNNKIPPMVPTNILPRIRICSVDDEAEEEKSQPTSTNFNSPIDLQSTKTPLSTNTLNTPDNIVNIVVQPSQTPVNITNTSPDSGMVISNLTMNPYVPDFLVPPNSLNVLSSIDNIQPKLSQSRPSTDLYALNDIKNDDELSTHSIDDTKYDDDIRQDRENTVPFLPKINTPIKKKMKLNKHGLSLRTFPDTDKLIFKPIRQIKSSPILSPNKNNNNNNEIKTNELSIERKTDNNILPELSDDSLIDDLTKYAFDDMPLPKDLLKTKLIGLKKSQSDNLTIQDKLFMNKNSTLASSLPMNMIFHANNHSLSTELGKKIPHEYHSSKSLKSSTSNTTPSPKSGSEMKTMNLFRKIKRKSGGNSNINELSLPLTINDSMKSIPSNKPPGLPFKQLSGNTMYDDDDIVFVNYTGDPVPTKLKLAATNSLPTPYGNNFKNMDIPVTVVDLNHNKTQSLTTFPSVNPTQKSNTKAVKLMGIYKKQNSFNANMNNNNNNNNGNDIDFNDANVLNVIQLLTQHGFHSRKSLVNLNILRKKPT